MTVLITAGGRSPGFEQLMKLGILRLALRLTGNMADAQDAAQEAFMRLHRYLDSSPDEHSVLPWLHRVTVNVCLDGGRKRKLRNLVPIDGIGLVSSAAS